MELDSALGPISTDKGTHRRICIIGISWMKEYVMSIPSILLGYFYVKTSQVIPVVKVKARTRIRCCSAGHDHVKKTDLYTVTCDGCGRGSSRSLVMWRRGSCSNRRKLTDRRVCGRRRIVDGSPTSCRRSHGSRSLNGGRRTARAGAKAMFSCTIARGDPVPCVY